MATYTTPQFNIFMDLWRTPALPSAGPPTFSNVQTQLYAYSRTPELLFHPGSGRWLPLIIIRVPFAFPVPLQVNDIFKLAGTIPQVDMYYRVQYFQLMHAGFPNRYYALYCLQCNINGTIPRTPIPL